MDSDEFSDYEDETAGPSNSKKLRPDTPERMKKIRGKSVMKDKHRKQKYRPEWELKDEFKKWLRSVKGDPYKASCIICKTDFTAELTVIKNHAKNKSHVNYGKTHSKQKTLLDFTKKSDECQTFEKKVKAAEVRTCGLLAEKNFSFNSVETIVARDKKCYPDSKIAQSVQLSREKASKIVKFVIGKTEAQNLAEKLRKKKFSVIIDESTDIGSVKNLCICVRFVDQGKVVSKFWALTQVFGGSNSADPNVALEGATANRLYAELQKTFIDAEVPTENIIGFASDGCNTMFGANNSVAQRMAEDYPGIMLSKCICHSLHLCASEACKELPRLIENLARDIYGFFKSSNKRQAEFLQFQVFFEVDVHKILRPSQTRWLSLNQVVSRILEQWTALMNFFNLKNFELKLLTTQNIVSAMKDPTTKMYYLFLQWILPKFVDLNKLFQGDGALIIAVFEEMCKKYKEILSSYLDRNYVTGTNLDEVDPKNEKHFLPLSQLYLGATLMNLESWPDLKNRSDLADLLQHFRMRCRNFLIKSAQEMLARFNFSENSLLAKIRCLHPKIVTSKGDPRRPSSITNLVAAVPRILNINDQEKVQKIDDQWRELDFTKFPFSNISQLSSADEFWSAIGEVSNLQGNFEFKELSEFALDILSLPHSSARCERVFSKVNLIKTKARNKLITSTINGLLLTAQNVESGGGCAEFPISDDMLSFMTKRNMYPQAQAEPSDRGDIEVDEEIQFELSD